MLVKYLTIHFFIFEIFLVSGINIENLGPKYPPTNGQVWPKPQQEVKGNTYYTYDSSCFKILITNYSCMTLFSAVERYSYIIKKNDGLLFRARKSNSKQEHKVAVDSIDQPHLHQGHISKLKVVLTAPCEEYPSFGMDESYNVKVAKVSILESASIWGALRGLETFVQLFYLNTKYNEIRINTTSITDFPSYLHRGFLLDTSRHYVTVGNILKTLDAMAINKMNVFHWHIVDHQSFPYHSERFPDLSNKGAFHQSMVYTKWDIQRIVQYARARGIRVIPEFDIPGHTRSWGAAYPDILTQCYSTNGKMVGLGPMDPLSDKPVNLLKDLLAEVQKWFPDKFFHVGGDEVDLDCWRSNPKLKEYMRQHSKTAEDLHALFMEKVIPLLGNDTTPIVWQDVFDEGVPLSKDTIVQVWQNWSTIEMLLVLYSGQRVLFSSDWYLSSLSREWMEYYKSDPRQLVYNFITDHNLLSNIVGGEACMWGEMVDDRNVISRVWPRASAVAENLWNSHPISWEDGAPWDSSKKIPDEVYNRIEEHTCRMIRRGIDAQPPSGPGFCLT